ncbi:MAG: hypothetical protein NTW10_09335 [Bacteroidetes bacterium]|nr:hypothetical protein [Bacteroidota bacterium]
MPKTCRRKRHNLLFPAFVLCIILITPSEVISQNENADLIERTTEKVSEISSQPIDFSDVSDVLDRLRDHPINLNNTNPEELSQLLFLDDRQITNLIIYIRTYGTLYSVFELKVVDGFDTSTIRKMLPYVAIGPEIEKHPLRLKDLLKSGRSQLLLRVERVIEKQAGYCVEDSLLEKNPDAGYAGSPEKLFFRYTYTFFNRLSIGISGEKDAGEQFFRGFQKYGMDFYSGYISLQNTGILRKVILGNFNAEFGQGLTLSSGISAGAIPGTGNIRRYSRGIVPSQSTNEGNYLRGVAIDLRKWNFRLSLFYSNHRRDANMIAADTLAGESRSFSSFTETGYHRMPGEIENKNAIHEVIEGGNLNFRNSFLSLGLTGFHSHWSAKLEPRKASYTIFNFRGCENLNYGIDFQVSVRNAFLFGEVSGSRNGGMAFLTGIQVNPDPRLIFSLSFRNYQRNYQDLLSNALGQNSLNANEQGCLFTFNAGISPGIVITGYADLYRFPWVKYRTDAPSRGSEYQLQCDYLSVKSLKMYLRFRIRSKEVNVPETTRPVNILEEEKSMTLRYQADWQVSELFLLKSRFEWLRNRSGANDPSYGYLFSENFSYKHPGKRFSLAFLYALFDTDSYNERIYAYESDVLYSYSVPAYYGKGLRFLLLIQWSPFRWMDLWGRYARTWYADRNIVGTGLDAINGDTKSEAEIQVRFRF